MDMNEEQENSITEESDVVYAPEYLTSNHHLDAGTTPVEAKDLERLDKATKDICEISDSWAFNGTVCILGDRNVCPDTFVVKATTHTTCNECKGPIQTGAAFCPTCTMSTFTMQTRLTLKTTAFQRIDDPSGAPFAFRDAKVDNKGRPVYSRSRNGQSNSELTTGEKRSKAKS